jgi:phage gp45-like
MHKMSPRASAFRAFTAGGARGIVDKVASWHLLQEMAGGFMQNEKRNNVEHAEPYGFTAAILPKDANGAAEAFMSFLSGSRSHPVATMISDRRFRPRGLKPGENAQYDDQGQMTLIRRAFVAVLSTGTDRFASLRHVEKSQQQKPGAVKNQQEAQTQQTQQENYKHEGDSVNTEVRSTKTRIEFRAGDTVVGYYDKAASKWAFIGDVYLGSETANKPIEVQAASGDAYADVTGKKVFATPGSPAT